ncbi:MAG TPA: HAMP domain-containing sensor histidine kinase [Polyangiaceae bacterium]|nr:HAMP domain-containing sensor histidine kinase [Polyangiaceae bacterium]
MGTTRATEASASAPDLIDIGTIQAPIALCSPTGRVEAATPLAMGLLKRLAVLSDTRGVLPPELWRLLEKMPAGEAVEWRPPGARGDVLGCTRYSAAQGSYLLLMREVSAKHIAWFERVQQLRLESTERLVTSIAQDIRGAVASISYSADFLEVGGGEMPREVFGEALHDIAEASRRLQQMVDGLLDYTSLGPNISVPVQLRDALNRAAGFLRSHYQHGLHRLNIDLAPRAEWVRGNPIVVEQIFINLLLNAAEAASTPRLVSVTAFPASAPGGHERPEEPFHVCVRVSDDGPGVPQVVRELVFEPFFTTKDRRPGLGLTIARQAARRMNGELVLVESERGACFALYLPSCEAPP